MVYGHVARKSSHPNLRHPKSELRRPKFYDAQQHRNNFYKAYFVSSVLKERKLYYKFILLVSFHQFVSSKVNEGDMLHTNPVCLASSSLEELTTYALDEISGDITLVSGDILS